MQATWEGHCAVNMEKQSCSTNTYIPSQKKKKKKLGTVMAPLARDQINQFRLLKYTFNSNLHILGKKRSNISNENYSSQTNHGTK